jgi:hypothetical protein
MICNKAAVFHCRQGGAFAKRAICFVLAAGCAANLAVLAKVGRSAYQR